MAEQSLIRSTKDYKSFKILPQNRVVSESHVTKLTRVFRDQPDALRYRPVLVNEKMEVIDGQHRLTAMQELGYPVYYQVGKGLTIADTQQMNAHQRNWTPYDYAKSYADGGNPEYVRYLYYQKKYGLPYRPTLHYLLGEGGDTTRINFNFRSGALETTDSDTIIDARFQKLEDAGKIMAQFGDLSSTDSQFARAFLVMMYNPRYDHDHFLHKLELFGHKYVRRQGSVTDYQRMLEQIYNEKVIDEAKRIRVF